MRVLEPIMESSILLSLGSNCFYEQCICSLQIEDILSGGVVKYFFNHGWDGVPWFY